MNRRLVIYCLSVVALIIFTGCAKINVESEKETASTEETSAYDIPEETKGDEEKSATAKKTVNEEVDEMYSLILDNIRCRTDSSVAGNLYITVADNESDLCTIEGKDKDKIILAVDENKKTITLKSKNKLNSDSVDIYIKANIKSIKAFDCKLDMDVDFGNVDNVELSLAGTFYGEMKTSANSFSIEVKGSGDLDVSGDSNDVDITIEGAMLLSTIDLTANNVKVNIKGTASCNVYASNSLDASLEGIGKISYVGNPKKVNKSVKGLGTIKAQ